MSLSYADAVAAVTAPGERFETTTINPAGKVLERDLRGRFNG